MTEPEWLAGSPIGKMLGFLDEQGVPERKRRLFMVACCQRVRHLLADARLVRALGGLKASADEKLPPDDHRELTGAARQAVTEIEAPLHDADGMLWPNDFSSAACAVLCDLAPSDQAGGGVGSMHAAGSVSFHVEEALG